MTMSAAVADDAPRLPHAVVAAGLDQAGCTVSVSEAEKLLDVSPLGHGLQLVQVPCWAAAYNFGSILFAIDPHAPAKARLLTLETWSDGQLTETYSLTLPSFDPKTKVLSSYHKGRGVGDCGEAGRWRWTGSRFKLTDYWNKEHCDGKLFEPAEQWRVFPPH